MEDCTYIELSSIRPAGNWHDLPCAYDEISHYFCELQLGAAIGSLLILIACFPWQNKTTFVKIVTITKNESSHTAYRIIQIMTRIPWRSIWQAPTAPKICSNANLVNAYIGCTSVIKMPTAVMHLIKLVRVCGSVRITNEHFIESSVAVACSCTHWLTKLALNSRLQCTAAYLGPGKINIPASGATLTVTTA